LGAHRQQVERDGHRYALYLLPARAQAIRLTTARPGTHGAIMDTMSVLVAEATGCRPIPLGPTADSGVITFRLECPGSAASG